MRLQEIKERYKPGTIHTYNNPMELLAERSSDVQYLLNRIERYEAALKKINHNAYLDVKGEDAELMLMMCGNIAEEALKESE